MAEEKKKEPKFSQEQYEMLMRCSEKRDMREWNDWRDKNPNEEIWLQGEKAFLAEAHLEKAQLWRAHLEGAILYQARLDGANLFEAHLVDTHLEAAYLIGTILSSCYLTGANLIAARLNGAVFNRSNLEGAKFNIAQVDSETHIAYCTFDKNTDFTGVAMDVVTIDPGLKAALKNNIMRIQWQKWFAEGNWAAQALKNCFVRPFWWMTGYGSSTANIIYYFVVLAYLFGSLYFFLEAAGYGVVEGLGVANMPWYHTWLRGLYFSVVTMTTLGFGDLYAMKTSYWGHVLLMAQVILGYVLLGALVTRLGILFTSEAPAAKPTQFKLKDKQSN